ncbi:hypothetical protein KR222_008520, partial [Zaprionus bogoriensis]
SSMEYVAVPPYGKQVLIGNWIDRRYAFDEKSNGILPGLSPSERCERHRSLSMDSYTDAGYVGDDVKRYFVERRVTRMRNFTAGTTSNVKLMDGIEMRNNFTTTNTLLYDLLPALRLKLTKTVATEGPPEPQPEPDLLASYGNQTKTYNFQRRMKCALRQEQRIKMRTTYDSAYS